MLASRANSTIVAVYWPSYLNDIHNTEYGEGVDHTNVGMEVAGHGAQGDDREEANE